MAGFDAGWDIVWLMRRPFQLLSHSPQPPQLQFKTQRLSALIFSILVMPQKDRTDR